MAGAGGGGRGGRAGGGGGRASKKGKAPKHQNKFAYRDHKHQAEYWGKIKGAPSPHLCKRCRDQIEWKKQYHKYKPLKAPAKCLSCQQKAIKHAYHVMCQPCARKEGCCAKCRTKEEAIVKDEAEEEAEAVEFEREVQDKLKSMSERERRKVLRELVKDSDSEQDEDEEEDEEEDNDDGEEIDSTGGHGKGVDDDVAGDERVGGLGSSDSGNAGGDGDGISLTNDTEAGGGDYDVADSGADDVLLRALEEANKKLSLVDGQS